VSHPSGFLDTYPSDLDERQGDERLIQRGFVHGWRSRVAPGNGEAFFDALVRTNLRPGSVVLDVGCGHGSYLRSLVPPAARGIGVDADPEVVAFARELAAECGARNVEFHACDLRAPGSGEPGSDAGRSVTSTPTRSA
jgi:SAM-dependent methyltransferase